MDDVGCNQYRYHPIDASNIRCVRLRPSKAQHQGHLRVCERIQGGYVALSYEWGLSDSSTNDRILIEDELGEEGSLSMTQNLRHALTDLGNSLLQSSLLFIDQLCINQQDITEKSVQVAGMSEVYRSADQVVVYLGPAEPSDAQAIELLESLDSLFGEWYDSLNARELRQILVRDQHERPETPEIPSLSPHDVSILKSFTTSIYASGWTRRLWMCQEVLMNKTVTFLKGSRLLMARPVFMLFVFMMSLLKSRTWLEPLDVDGDPFTLVQATRMLEARKWRHQIGIELSLLELLNDFSTGLACSDTRDKVYAVLGLSNDSLGIVPDYRADTVDVFIDVARRSIEANQDLRILSYVSHETDSLEQAQAQAHIPTNRSSWPTWVPAFQTRVPVFRSHRASGSTLSKLAMDSNQRVLNVKGHQIGEIETVAGIFGNGPYLLDAVPPDTIRRFLVNIEIAKEALAAKNIKDPESRLCYGIMASYPTGRFWEDYMPPGFVADRALSTLIHAMQRALVVVNRCVRKPSLIPLVLGDDPESCSAADLFRRFHGEGRALCVTATGDVVLATKAVRTGDIAAVLAGGSEVYVLRKTVDNRYLFVGSAYARGYMKGETIDDTEWQMELRHVLLEMLACKNPPAFSGVLDYDVDEIVACIGMMLPIDWAEIEARGDEDISIWLSDQALVFFHATLSEQMKMLQQAVTWGTDTPQSTEVWRKRWWPMIQRLIEAGVIRSPRWMTDLRTFMIV